MEAGSGEKRYNCDELPAHIAPLGLAYPGLLLAHFAAFDHHSSSNIEEIPPFWEINSYTLVKTDAGWRVVLLNIHNQIGPGDEGPGQKVPEISAQPK